MLEEKEVLASELQSQLEEAMKAEETRVVQLEENLVVKGREVANVTADLNEQSKDVDTLEEVLEKVRKELVEYCAETEAAAKGTAMTAGSKSKQPKEDNDAI